MARNLLVAVRRLMVSSNPRVGEIKLEEIVDRSIVRKLDDSGFIDRMYSVYPAKWLYLGELFATELAGSVNRSDLFLRFISKIENIDPVPQFDQMSDCQKQKLDAEFRNHLSR